MNKPLPIGSVYKGGNFKGRKQAISKVAQDSQIYDESLTNLKKPNADLNTKQRIASTGETVPIVFGKRVNNIGGIWLQPSLLKAGTLNFRQAYLFAISQSEIAINPNKNKAYVGTKKIALLLDSTITTTHIFNSATTLSANPTSCPLQGTGLFCGYNNYSYLTSIIPASSGSPTMIRFPDKSKESFIFNYFTHGTGDTTNTIFDSNFQIFDAETGVDVTNATNINSLLAIPPNNLEAFNVRRDGNGFQGNIIGGQPVNHIHSFTNFTNGALFIPLNSTTVASSLYTQQQLNDLLAISNGNTLFNFKYTFNAINNQINTNNPPSTGTLTGVQIEFIIGDNNKDHMETYTNLDNSSFADITFLLVGGQLFESPFEGTYPTEMNQLYIFYEEGVKVDLYSNGLINNNYLIGSSNQFIDLAMYLFKIYKKLNNNMADIVTPIDISNLQALASFCTNNNLFFNGIISKSVNIIDYITTISPFYFLSFLSVGGKFKFSPILPINSSNQIDTGTLTPVITFDESNILELILKKIYFNVEDRRSFVANVIYTECIPTEVSKTKTVTVRFTNNDVDSPTEQFDLSEFCSSVDHAILYAKYELATRKHSTHEISFTTTLSTVNIIPTNIVKLQLIRKNSVGDNRTEINYYQVTSITYNNDGTSNIQGQHFPLNSNNESIITNEMTSNNFTVLQ